MKYTVLESIGLLEVKVPTKVRIDCEEHSPQAVLTSLIAAAYDLSREFGVAGLGGLAALGSPEYLSTAEAASLLNYDSTRSVVDRLFGRQDTRVPSGVHLSYYSGRPMTLQIRMEGRGYVMDGAHVFDRDIIPIGALFKRANELLPIVSQELLY